MITAILWAMGLVLAFLIAFLFAGWPTVAKNVTYGVTFTRAYARDDLKLDPDAVLTAALDDLGIRRFRIPATWKFIQPTETTFDFTDLDRDIAMVANRGGTIVLAVGEKLPRWPECWGPDWWKKLPRDEQRSYTLKYVETAVRRYRNVSAVVAWQVENEPHFVYGDCPTPDIAFLKQEVALVRGLDPTRPVATTDSGELSSWLTFGRTVDQLGVSVYRVVRNPILGTWRYFFIPPWFYERKGMLVSLFGMDGIYVSEFQMEPWSNQPLTDTPVDDQLKTMDLKQMKSNFWFAERMHVSPIDFWGVEWWYWMKEKGHPEFWDAARDFYRSHK